MMENDLISRSNLWTDIMMLPHNGDIISSEEVEQAIVDAPAVDAVEVTERELQILIDAMDHRIWKMEDQGRDLINKHLYINLVELRNKLAAFGAEHFGDRRGNDGC